MTVKSEGLGRMQVTEGMRIDWIRLPVTYTMVAGVVGGTRDYFPGHHDPRYARAQGLPDIYLNTTFLQGLLDRIALQWAGPSWFVRRRTLLMHASIFPGDVIEGSGTVTAVADDGPGPMIVLDLRIGVGEEVRASGVVEIVRGVTPVSGRPVPTAPGEAR